MSFGGSVSAMITTMKNNSRRKKRSHFDRNSLHENGSNEKFNELLKRTASPEQLEAIRAKVKADKKRTLIKTTVFSVIILICLFVLVKYLF